MENVECVHRRWLLNVWFENQLQVIEKLDEKIFVKILQRFPKDEENHWKNIRKIFITNDMIRSEACRSNDDLFRRFFLKFKSSQQFLRSIE